MKRQLAGLVIATLPAGGVAAQEDAALEGSERPPEVALLEEDGAAGDRVSIQIGSSLVGEYISRGIGFAKEPSLQPYIQLNVALPELTGGAITDARVFVGNWNNIRLGSLINQTSERRPFLRFFETDAYVGGAVEIAERWNLSATYYRYASLGGAFEGYNDFELIAAYSDAGQWDSVPLRNFSVNPSLRMVQEAGRPGRADALYVQPSLSPSFDIGSRDNPVRVTVPLVAGFADEYYDDRQGGHPTFGFFRTGATVSGTPLPDMAPALSLNGGVDLWMLNDRVASGLAPTKVVGRVGASWGF